MKRALILAAFFLMAPQRADAEQPIPDFCFSTVEVVRGIPVSTAFKVPMRCWAIVKAAVAMPTCKMPNRVMYEGRCWLKSRIHLMHKEK